MRKASSIFMTVVLCVAAFVGCGTGTNSESLEELIALGAQYLVDGNYSEAVVAFEKAIAIDDKSTIAYMGLGDANIGLENYEKAGEAFEKIIELDSMLLEAYIARADVFLFTNDPGNAIAILIKGLVATDDYYLNDIIGLIENNDYKPSKSHIEWGNFSDAKSVKEKITQIYQKDDTQLAEEKQNTEGDLKSVAYKYEIYNGPRGVLLIYYDTSGKEIGREESGDASELYGLQWVCYLKDGYENKMEYRNVGDGSLNQLWMFEWNEDYTVGTATVDCYFDGEVAYRLYQKLYYDKDGNYIKTEQYNENWELEKTFDEYYD